MYLVRRQCTAALSSRLIYVAFRTCNTSLPWDDDLDSDTLPQPSSSTHIKDDVALMLRRPTHLVTCASPAPHWMERPVGCSEGAVLPLDARRVLSVHPSKLPLQLESPTQPSPGLVLHPEISPSQLLSVADSLVEKFIPQVTDITTLYDLVRIFEFPSTSGAVVTATPKHLSYNALTPDKKMVVQALRHEGVFKSAYWRTFKWDVFGMGGGNSNTLVDIGPHSTRTAIQQMPEMERANIVLTTTRMFHSAVSQGFTRDPQMLLAAVGRLIDVVPFMNGVALAETFDGVKIWGRMHFSLNEVIQDISTHTAMPDTGNASHSSEGNDAMEQSMDTKSMASAAGPQSNLVDVLLDTMEGQLADVGAYMSVEQLLKVVEGLAFSGIRNPSIIAHLAKCTLQLSFTPLQTAMLLQHAAGIHERIVEVLVGKGGPSSSWVDAAGLPLSVDDALRMASPLFVEAAKKIQIKSLQGFGRHHPEVILALRRMCETNALVVSEVPLLWEEIRGIPISKNIVQAEQRKRELGAFITPARLQRLEYDRNKLTNTKFKAKPVVERGERRDLPPQFKTWMRDTRTPTERRKQTLIKRSSKRSPYVRFGTVDTGKWQQKMGKKAHTGIRY